eukprot:TRINITY_DN2901_c0_g1_i1.p1 TRINITY_DN2901_c0_g1~~TRINITY_DN2901_c0_g1_i1.p1  ORF type:complete len:189 (-),score=57.78 TRINITY_DN2901_c0_g1_i1:98-664(-)
MIKIQNKEKNFSFVKPTNKSKKRFINKKRINKPKSGEFDNNQASNTKRKLGSTDGSRNTSPPKKIQKKNGIIAENSIAMKNEISYHLDKIQQNRQEKSIQHQDRRNDKKSPLNERSSSPYLDEFPYNLKYFKVDLDLWRDIDEILSKFQFEGDLIDDPQPVIPPHQNKITENQIDNFLLSILQELGMK